MLTRFPQQRTLNILKTAMIGKPGISSELFGEKGDKKVYLFTLRNATGSEVRITNYGGIITSWITRDQNGNRSNIVAGFNSFSEYEREHPYFGAIIGRYCNRIKQGRFSIAGVPVQVTVNNGNNHLHGGIEAFDKQVWTYFVPSEKLPRLQLRLVSRDGDNGFPGTLYVVVEYTLTSRNELIIRYQARSDAPTPVNLTNHSYFNLSGDFNTSVASHQVCIFANHYTPVDKEQIPTGVIKPVAGTPFDFLKCRTIGSGLHELENGYDHNFVLNKRAGRVSIAAVAKDPVSGRKLEVFTTEPGMQFYTGNHLDGTFLNERGQAINKHHAFCFETQHFPDSPNQREFPCCVLYPGENYFSETMYRVGVSG